MTPLDQGRVRTKIWSQVQSLSHPTALVDALQNSLEARTCNGARVGPPSSCSPRSPLAARPSSARAHGRPVRSRRRRPVHSLVPQSHSLVSIVQLACSLLWCEIASRARRWPARWHRRSAVVAVRFSPVQCRSARGCARERGWPNVVAHRGCPVRAGVDALLGIGRLQHDLCNA